MGGKSTARPILDVVVDPEVGARYLLADLSDEERAWLEERLLAEDELFEEILAVEDDLIHAYLHHEMSGDDLVRFERHLGESLPLAARVEFTRALDRVRPDGSAPAEPPVEEG